MQDHYTKIIIRPTTDKVTTEYRSATILLIFHLLVAEMRIVFNIFIATTIRGSFISTHLVCNQSDPKLAIMVPSWCPRRTIHHRLVRA